MQNSHFKAKKLMHGSGVVETKQTKKIVFIDKYGCFSSIAERKVEENKSRFRMQS